MYGFRLQKKKQNIKEKKYNRSQQKRNKYTIGDTIMVYKVDKFNGTFLVNVADGSIDTSTDLRLIGKNYAGYGEIENENFLHLLENFANTSPPPKAIVGQLWYDSTATVKKLKFWDGTQWKVASGAVSQGTSPSGITTGELWFDTSTSRLNVWNGSEFILVGPESTPETTSTTFISEIVKDTSEINHTILRGTVLDSTIIVISKDEFDLKLNTYQWAQGGFSKIKKGITLVNSQGTNGATTTDHTFWGTASTARGLIGPGNTVLTHADLVLQSASSTFLDNGLFVGESNDLRIWIESNTIPVIENQNFSELTNSIVLRLKTDGTGGKVDPLIITRTGIMPGSANTFSIGTSLLKWASIHATTVNGNLTGNVTGNVIGRHTGNLEDINSTVKFNATTGTFTGIFGTNSEPGLFTGTFTGTLNGTASSATTVGGYSFSISTLANTIPVRDIDGILYSTRFSGIADNADQLLVGTVYRSASTSQSANTIAVRDSNADITARVFNGTATSANYADLAEKYLPDAEYETGTVVSIGGTHEITSSKYGDRAIGVISEFPAFMMNKDLENGVYVALKGRVPVIVVGSVKKGDRLIASNNGTAVAMSDFSTICNTFAIALESNSSDYAKLVEAVIL